jgi:hypothetical protein
VVAVERRLLGELLRVREYYPRRGISRAWVEELARLVRRRVKWHTPLVVDRENYLLDGWHRYEAYRLVHSDWPLVAVDVRVVDCDPEERLLAAAELNRAHGRRLTDDEAVRVAARCALAQGAEGERELVRAARRLARRLAVDPRLVVAALFPAGTDGRSRSREVRPARRPPLVFAPEEFTVENVRLACEWLADALAACGRDAAADPDARSAMERAWAALDYALGERLPRAGRDGGIILTAP